MTKGRNGETGRVGEIDDRDWCGGYRVVRPRREEGVG